MTPEHQFVIYNSTPANVNEFIDFWSRVGGSDPQEDLYDSNIRTRPMSPESVRQLYVWKNGTRLSERKTKSVEVNFVARCIELDTLPEETSAEGFLSRFRNGGAIFRIFWLHLWRPNRFPIFDQHVWRAMSYLNRGGSGRPALKTLDDRAKLRAYLNEYIPWFEQSMGKHAADPRADRALWRFGQFLSKWRLDSTSRRFTDPIAFQVIK